MLSFGVQLTLCAVSGLALAGPPESPTHPVTDTLHGVKVTDPYRWLEGDNTNPDQMGKMNDEVAKWTDAQNAYTRSVLDTLPGRKDLEKRMEPLMEIGSVSAPVMRRHSYFYTKREGKEAQPRIFVRDGSDAQPRLLLDPQKIDPSGLTALGGFVPSQDGGLLAYGLYHAGDENTTTYVMDVKSGERLKDEIPGKSGVIEWLPDASGFFYERLADVKNPYSAQIRFHKLGNDPEKDPILFRQYTKEENEKLATTWGPGATVSRDARWLVLTYWTGTASNDIWAVDLTKWFKDGTFDRKEIKVGADATFEGEIEGDTLYMLTDYKAPNKRLVAVNLNHTEEDAWQEIIPERKDAVLTGVGLAKGVIAADYEEKASTRIRLFDMHGKSLGDLMLPGIGSAGLSVETDRTEAYLSFASYNYPSTIFRVDLAKPDASPVVWERPNVPVDPTIAVVEQVTYTSKDGTPVTMFIVHRKDLKLDGNNPTILYGYGGFNISMTPGFQATVFPWLEDGGVYAVANLRGGGEYGKTWHEGGMLAHKQNVFDDFYAAAEYLIKQNYTSPKKLAILGGSNGGLLTGTAVTQRPDLYAAAIVAVPLLDMLRYQHFLMARYWVPEYGDADKSKDELDWLYAYSPYQHVKPGTKYPAVLLTAGENDTRVHPMHARKMAAALQAAVAGEADANPVLLWVDREAGHGQGKPLNLRVRDVVDQRIFLMWRLGMLPKVGAMMDIVGMHCEMCVADVEDRLKKVPGVKSVEVSLAGSCASVVFDERHAPSSKALLAAFEGSELKASLR